MNVINNECMNKVIYGRIDTLKNAPPLWGSGGGGSTAIGWSGWSGGKAGSEERCFPPVAVFSLTFCLSGFRPHEMLQIEVSMLQNCLKNRKSSVELC